MCMVGVVITQWPPTTVFPKCDCSVGKTMDVPVMEGHSQHMWVISENYNQSINNVRKQDLTVFKHCFGAMKLKPLEWRKKKF